MIWIDDREEVHKQEAKRISSHIQSPFEIKRMEYADIAFRGNGPEGPVAIGIERKRFRDMIDSLASGRLAGHQFLGLMNSYDHVYILVEGYFKIGNDGYLRRPKGNSWVVVQVGKRPIPASFLYNWLNELFITCNVGHTFTPSIHASAVWVDGLYKWWGKDWGQHSALQQFYAPPPPARAFFRPPTELVRMVKEIEGVGWEKAKEIGKRFSCMWELCQADIKELTQIKGIGPKLAGRILSSLKGGVVE